MSFFRNLIGAIKGVIPQVISGAKAILASGTLQPLVGSIISGAKDLIGKYSTGRIQNVTSSRDLPAFASSFVSAAKEAAVNIKTAAAPVLEVLAATNARNPNEALLKYRGMVTTLSGLERGKNFESSMAVLGVQANDSSANMIENIEAAEPARVIDQNVSKTAEQFDVVNQNIKDAIKALRALAIGADVGTDGYVTTGQKRAWDYEADMSYLFATDATELGANLVSLGSAPATGYAIGKQGASKVRGVWAATNSTPDLYIGVPQLPKTTCYDWYAHVRLRFFLSITAPWSSVGKVELVIASRGNVLARRVLTPVADGVPATLFMNVRVPITSLVTEVMTFTVVTDIAGTIATSYELDHCEAVGVMKPLMNDCPVTDVDYWNGATTVALDSSSTWAQILGKVDRLNFNPRGFAADPNLGAARIWDEFTPSSDIIWRIGSIVDKALLEATPGVDNHNTFIYNRYGGKTLTDFCDVGAWVYKDGPMASLTVDQKLSVYEHLLKTFNLIPDFLTSHPTLQLKLYDELSSVSS